MTPKRLLFLLFLTGANLAVSQNIITLVDTSFSDDWSSSQNVYKPSDRYLFTYNSYGQLIQRMDQRLLSGTWEDFQRLEYEYDQSGRQLDFSSYDKVNGVWNNARSYRYTYNIAGQLISNESYMGDQTIWSKSSKNTYIYDSSGKVIEQITELNDGNNQWVNGTLTTYTYDSAELVTENLTQTWVNGSWENVRQYLYTFSNGAEVERIRNAWVSGAWEGETRWQRVNNANGSPIEFLYQNFDGTGWENDRLDSSYYNNQGQAISRVSRIWQNGVFENSFHNRFEYDGQGNINVQESKLWSLGQWTFTQRIEMTLNSKARETQKTYFGWNANTASWENNLKQETTYLLDSLFTEILNYKWVNNQWEHVQKIERAFDQDLNLTDVWQYEGDGFNFIPLSHFYYKYMEFSANTLAVGTEGKASSIKIYPNPTESFAYISIKGEYGNEQADFQLFNLSGKLVRSNRFSVASTYTFVRGHLSSGLYHYRILLQDGKELSGSLILK